MAARKPIRRFDMASKSGGAGRMRANVFQVRLQGVVRLLLYLLLGGLLLLAEALVVILLHRALFHYQPKAADAPTYGAAALAAVVYLPMFARLRWALDSILYHDTYEVSAVLREYSQRFGALSDQENITRFLLDSLERTINLAAIAYVALPEGLDAGVMQVLEAGDIHARGQFATEEGKARMLTGLAGLPKDEETALRRGKALRTPWRGCEALVLIESVSGGSIAGLLVIGSKRAGGSLQRKDRQLVVTVAHLVGTAYANALLIQGLHVSLVQVQTSTNQLLAARAELQLLLRELVSAEERERSALARDLHDDALQEVLYVIRHAQFCTRLASELEASWRASPRNTPLLMASPPGPPAGQASAEDLSQPMGASAERLRTELAQLSNRSQVLEQKLRALCMGLYPEALRVLGLPTALEELATQVARTTGMHVVVSYDDEVARLAEDLLPERAVHLYRIAQEALTNAGKHANATSGAIYLSLLSTLPDRDGEHATPETLWLCLTISDDGAGLSLPLNMGALVRSGHLGLAGMRERAEQLEGRLEFRREPAGGTRVMIMAPVGEMSLLPAASAQAPAGS
jgi:signal transduction histidine kinase